VPSRTSKPKFLRTTSSMRFFHGSLLGGFCPVLQPRGNHLGLMCLFSQDKIMEMEFQLLISKFNNPKTIELAKEKIGNISDGSSPHCAGALKLGLKKAFDVKKQKRQPPGVKLRCTYSGCAWYTNHVSYSSVGSNTYCPHCQCGYYMQCVGCGYNRTSNYTSCQSCGKKFA
jgi:hypothetical protein